MTVPSVITNIVYKKDRDRFWVFVNGSYCCSIRGRTFKGMSLFVGKEISCTQIEEMEKFHFKRVYNETSWEKEGVRLEKVKNLIDSFFLDIRVELTGFGAGSTEFILDHPEEQGRPDMELVLNETSKVVMAVEVTGTEVMRGSDYWVRPDKLEYAKNHPYENVWLVLHYAKPFEKFVVIKPDTDKEYPFVIKSIRGTDEKYVIFNDRSPEVVTVEHFREYLATMVFNALR
ncbi:hypothetical protein [Halomonas litopenaei]|uniref:hypothetical protein n=1 Tax=Halomonas litopenaei TaxID=2109328 RepID=UPI003F9EEC00